MRFLTLAVTLLLGIASAIPAPVSDSGDLVARHGRNNERGYDKHYAQESSRRTKQKHKKSKKSHKLSKKAGTCQNPLIRKEWRTLSNADRKKYINAVICLTKKPSKAPSSKAPGARHRYDDFNAVHIISSDGLIQGTGGVHLVGFFLHWHRYFIATFEKALRNECGYTGALPYWDWTIDADSGNPIQNWPVYDATYGFGGNGPYVEEQPVSPSWPYMEGQTGGGCVSNGPFKNVKMNVGPGYNLTYNPHCVHRGLNPTRIQYLKSAKVAASKAASTFVQYDTLVQGEQTWTPDQIAELWHSAGHHIHGGDSTDFISSTTEPIFWLHHSYIDKLYWEWQQKKPSVRLTEVGGVTIPFDVDGPQVTLDTPLNLQWEAATVKVRNVMHIQGGPLCYKYQ